MADTTSPRLTDYGLLVLLAAIFGSNFMMTKIAVQAVSPWFVVCFRLGVAALILIAIMLAARMWFPKPGPVWWAIAGSAFFGHTLPFMLISWGQVKVDAGLAAILMATMPLFTLLLAQVFTKDEKPNRYSISGFSIALAGIIVLFGVDKLASLADQSLRQYALVGAAMSYGVNAIITKYLTGLAWQQSTASFVGLAFLMSLPLMFLVDFSTLQAGPIVWGSLFYTAIMPTAIGAILIVLIIRRNSASFLSQINFMVPLFGVAFAILLVNEQLPANAALALIIILIGVGIARRRPKREIVPINRGN